MPRFPTRAPLRTPPHLATLTVLTATSVLTLNMFLPSLPAMTLDLETSASVMAIAVSGYMLMSAVLQILLGPLSDRFGRRPVMLAAMAGYAGASLGAVMAQDVVWFLGFRLAQSLVMAGSVLSSAIIRDQFSAREAAGKLGTISAAMALAPMLGPLLGGVLETTIGWRAIFGVYTALGAAALAMAFVDQGETARPRTTPLRARDYATLLRARLFWAYVLCQSFAVGSFYIFVTGVPFVATQTWGLSPALTGLGLGSITAGFMLGAAITSRTASRVGFAPLILAGRLAAALGLATGLAILLLGIVHPLVLFGFTLFVGLGNGLTLPSANAGALSVRPDLAGTAAGLNGALTIGTGAVLTWATAFVIDRAATPAVLIALMLASAVLALIAGLVATRMDPGAS